MQVQEWTQQAALKKGLKIGCAIAAGAVASILIPLIHFLSVPAGLLAAPVIGVVIYKAYVGQFEIVEGAIECQYCGEVLSLQQLTFLDSIQVECKKCKDVIHLTSLLQT